MQLRDYQTQFVDDFRHALAQGDRYCVGVLPTGAGKTVIAAQIAKNVVDKGKRLLFLAHRDPLIFQTRSKFEAFGLDTGLIKAGQPLNPTAPAQIAQIQTLATGNIEVPDWDLLILDEAHYTSFFQFSEQLLEQSRGSRGKAVLALTATPYRLGKKSLADHYTRLIQGPTVRSLTERGFLVPARYFGHDKLDLKRVGVSARTGDFDERQLQQALNTKALNQKLAQEYQRLAGQRRGIIFAVGIEHCKGITEAFNEADIPAAFIDGSMSTKKRDTVYSALKQDRIQAIVSVGTLTEGYDEPLIEFVGLARPTLSPALYEQMVGRGIRLCDAIGKTDCIVYDFGTGNYQRFGRIDAPKEISLENMVKPENPVEVINCPKCSAYISALARLCPECRTVLVETVEPELEPFDDVPNEFASEQLSDEELEQRQQYRKWLRTAYQQGYKPGWAIVRYKEEHGTFPTAWWGQGAIFGLNPTDTQREQYTNHLRHLADKHKHDADWIDRYVELEFGEGFNAPSLALAS
jgi:superfamily II DNA or RNA helicase